MAKLRAASRKTQKSQISLAQCVTAQRLLKKLESDLVKKESLSDGTQGVEGTIKFKAVLNKALDTEAYPNFSFWPVVRTILIRYAASQENPTEFLQSLFGETAVKAVLTKGSDKCLAKVNPKVINLFSGIEDKAKEIFQSLSEKKPKSGSVTVNGDVELVE